MKRVLFSISLLAVVFCLVSVSYAESVEKFNEIGIGSHAIILQNDDFDDDETDFSGLSIYYQRNITKNFAAKVSAYFDENNDNSDINCNGIEGLVMFGNNFTGTGWAFMVGAGFFSETWDNDNYDYDLDFSGAMLGFGVGHNWDQVSVDFTVNLRTSKDYEDELDVDSVSAASGCLSVGFRF